MGKASHDYVIALGSNRRHRRHGDPRAVLASAVVVLGDVGRVCGVSPVLTTAAIGPSRRRYANAAIVLRCGLMPTGLLRTLKDIEQHFGTRRGGRWAARTLDLDIILWSGGIWASSDLIVPHPAFRERIFVLDPAATVAAGWRDPLTGQTLRQHLTRHARRREILQRSRMAGVPAKRLDPQPPASYVLNAVGPLAQSVEQLTFNQ